MNPFSSGFSDSAHLRRLYRSNCDNAATCGSDSSTVKAFRHLTSLDVTSRFTSVRGTALSALLRTKNMRADAMIAAEQDKQAGKRGAHH